MSAEPDLSAELDAAEDIMMGRAEHVTEWGSRDSGGRLFAYQNEATARSVVLSRREKGLKDTLVCRSVTYGPWEAAE